MPHTRAILELCRVSNLPTVAGNVLAAWFLAGGGWDGRLAACAVAAGLCHSGGMILNDVFDAEWDRRHGKRRPIPRGEIPRRLAGVLGWASLSAGGAGLAWLGANPLWTAGLCAGIVFYNALHKRWAGAAWLMAACRFFLFIAVASIPAGVLPGRVWIWGAALAVYVAGITVAARHEDTSGRVAGWSLAPLLAPAACPFLLLAAPGPALAWSPILAVLFAGWVLSSHRQLRLGQIGTGRFVGRLLAGMVLVDAMALGGVSPAASLLCLLLLPLHLFLQGFVSAT